MRRKSRLAVVYISCKTALVEDATIFDFINIVSFAFNLMTFCDGKILLETILVHARLKPIGRYKVGPVGNIN